MPHLDSALARYTEAGAEWDAARVRRRLRAMGVRRLSLSPHTVSSHLRRSFTKLNITSRVELAQLAAARDSGE